jgi:hypothetical protein
MLRRRKSAVRTIHLAGILAQTADSAGRASGESR